MNAYGDLIQRNMGGGEQQEKLKLQLMTQPEEKSLLTVLTEEAEKDKTALRIENVDDKIRQLDENLANYKAIIDESKTRLLEEQTPKGS